LQVLPGYNLLPSALLLDLVENKKKRRLWFFKAAAEIKERQATVLILLQYGYWGHKLKSKKSR